MSMSVETEPREIGDTSPAGLMAIGAARKPIQPPDEATRLARATGSFGSSGTQYRRAAGAMGAVQRRARRSEQALPIGGGVWSRRRSGGDFASGLGVGAAQRTRLPRTIGTTYLAGLGANVVKFLLARSRPHTIEQLRGTSPLATFHGWLPAFSHGSAWQSFPSSHTAAAVGLALGLSWVFPRGKWLFAAFAVLAAGQRIVSSNHFLSDVLWGAALGWICAAACLPGGWLSPLFDRLETWQASLVQRVER